MTTAVRTSFVTLLALGVAAWPSLPLSGQSTAPSNDHGPAGFPIETYTSCAHGAHNPSGNQFLNVVGFQDGTRLTLARRGSTLTSTYVDQYGVAQSLTFSTATHTLATIARKGQLISGFRSLCVLGPGRETFHPATMSVTAGALAYDADMAFLTLTGNLRSDAGACGTLSLTRETFWLACEDRQGGAVRASDAGPAPVAQLPVGQYSCHTQLDALGHSNGLNQDVVGGATGTLMLTENGATVTAQYSGDPALSGTLRFTATTSMTASPETGQRLMASCMIRIGAPGPSGTPQPVHIAAGSLAVIDSTLFLSFAGTMADSSSCLGANVAGSLICSK